MRLRCRREHYAEHLARETSQERRETLSKRERNARHQSRLTSVEQASERTQDHSRRKRDTGQERGHRLDDQRMRDLSKRERPFRKEDVVWMISK